MLRKLLLISLLILWIASFTRAQDITVSQSLNRTEVPYESTAVFEVVLTWSGPSGAFMFNRPPHLELERLKVAQVSSTVSSSGVAPNEVTTRKINFVLKPTSSGLATINPAGFEYLRLADSVAGSVSTQALTLTVAEPIRVTKRKAAMAASRWRLAVTAGGVLVLLAGVYLFVRRRNRRPRPVVQTPAELFIAELGALRQSSGSDLKRFQTGLYKLLITFLADEYRLALSGLTTRQALDLLEHTSLTPEQRVKFAGWLWRAEREKFSPLAVAPGETIRLEAEIRDFFETNMMSKR
ncbi:MAG: hypothetical protein HY851_12395 [candidate division Zixibacteria bacterium]|nr:hypothetical protein [candidate division Zixibacteria bacterium]